MKLFDQQRVLAVIGTSLFILLASEHSLSDSVIPISQEVEEGKEFYEKLCFGCHSLDENRVGPRYFNLFNRVVETQEKYVYSETLLKASELGDRWTSNCLDRWLKNPSVLYPGAIMVSRVVNPQRCKKLIAYFESLMTKKKTYETGIGLF